MAEKKETAEQQLLKMIETAAAPEASKAQRTVVKKQGVVSVVRSMNKILFFAVLAAGIFLVNEIRLGAQLLNQTVDFNVDQTAARKAGSMEALIPTIQSLAFYTAGISHRNFFQPYEKQPTQTADSSSENKSIARKISNLRLVGISWMNSVDSASVMIEDTNKKVTYFLQKGEKIDDVIVKTIYADSAVLGYDNEEITIRYDKSQK